MIRAFAELIKDLTSRGISPGVHFMENEASTALKMEMTTMDIKYQLVTQNIHRAKNAQKSIHTFQKHFIAGLCSVDKYFHLQFWYRLLHQTIMSLNLLRKSSILTPPIILHQHIQRTQLQTYTVIATNENNIHSQQSKQWSIVGTTWRRRMVHRTSNRTLKMP